MMVSFFKIISLSEPCDYLVLKAYFTGAGFIIDKLFFLLIVTVY